MRKTLKIIALSTGIVSTAAAAVLGYIYLEDIAGYVKTVKTRIADKKSDKSYIGAKYEHE